MTGSVCINKRCRHLSFCYFLVAGRIVRRTPEVHAKFERAVATWTAQSRPSLNDLARTIGVTPSHLGRWLLEAGLDPRPPRTCRTCGRAFRPTRETQAACGKSCAAREPIEVRFWRHVDKSGECWEWTGQINRFGYGLMSVESRRAARTAHRIAWRLTHGDIPAGLHVCHSCDNRRCVRPDHLWLGTNADNVADRERKGRHHDCRGENASNAKITWAIAGEIRRLSAEGLKRREIASALGTTPRIVDGVTRGGTWRDAGHAE